MHRTVGNKKLEEEIDRDRQKEGEERKEGTLHYGRSNPPLESVYLFSRQEKSYW